MLPHVVPIDERPLGSFARRRLLRRATAPRRAVAIGAPRADAFVVVVVVVVVVVNLVVAVALVVAVVHVCVAAVGSARRDQRRSAAGG